MRSHRSRLCSVSGTRPPGRRPSRSTGVGEEHEREQPGHLSLVGRSGAELPGETDRLGAELYSMQSAASARGVPLVEHQIEHVQDGSQAPGSVDFLGHHEQRPAVADSRLGPADSLRDGRLRHQQAPGDLRRGEAAHRAQGERDLRGRSQCRVTAHKQQRQRVVLIAGTRCVYRLRGGDSLLPTAARRVAAPHFDPPAACGRDEPAFGVVGGAVVRPLYCRRDQGLLHRVLADIESLVPPSERGQDRRNELAQQIFGPSVGILCVTRRACCGRRPAGPARGRRPRRGPEQRCRRLRPYPHTPRDRTPRGVR